MFIEHAGHVLVAKILPLADFASKHHASREATSRMEIRPAKDTPAMQTTVSLECNSMLTKLGMTSPLTSTEDVEKA